MEKLNRLERVKNIENYYIADFETTTLKSNYFKTTNQGALIAWLIEPLGDISKTYQGIDFDSFERFLLSLEEPSVIFFHNLSKFDGYVIMAYAIDRWSCNLRTHTKSEIKYSYQKVLGGLLTFTIQTPKTTIVLQDSWRLLSLGVEGLGKILGYPKLTTDYHIDPVKQWEDLPEDFRTYLKRDVDIVNISLVNFKENIEHLNEKYGSNLNPFAITSSSLARSIISFFDENNVFKITKMTQDWAYHYTRGGFTNFNHKYILETVHKDIIMYDAKSHYPSVMWSKKLPAGPPEFYEDVKEFKKLFLENKAPNYEVIFCHVHGRIKKSLSTWGVIPVAGQIDNYIYEPEETDTEFDFYGLLDEWKACMPFYEFHEWEFEEIPYWEEGQMILKSVIEDLYQLKETQKNNLAYKLILNSMYGSCGMKHTYPTEIYFAKNEEPVVEFKKWKRHFQYLSSKQENFYHKKYNLYEYEEIADDNKECWNKWIAAAITSYGRTILINLIARNPDKILYGDTDSLIMFKDTNLFKPEELGKTLTKWDIDKEGITHCRIFGPKRYFLYKNNELIKNSFAGVSKKYWEGKSEEEINAYFANDYIVLDNAQMRRIKKSEYNYFPFLEEINYVDNITMRRKNGR